MIRIELLNHHIREIGYSVPSTGGGDPNPLDRAEFRETSTSRRLRRSASRCLDSTTSTRASASEPTPSDRLRSSMVDDVSNAAPNAPSRRFCPLTDAFSRIARRQRIAPASSSLTRYPSPCESCPSSDARSEVKSSPQGPTPPCAAVWYAIAVTRTASNTLLVNDRLSRRSSDGSRSGSIPEHSARRSCDSSLQS